MGVRESLRFRPRNTSTIYDKGWEAMMWSLRKPLLEHDKGREAMMWSLRKPLLEPVCGRCVKRVSSATAEL